jgi:hypothetical protein
MPDNGQVERMNQPLKEVAVRRFHYESHDQLRQHLADYLAAYNYARRLKIYAASRPTKPSAKPGPTTPPGSSTTRTTKCRD